MPFITPYFTVRTKDGRNSVIVPPLPRYGTQVRGPLEVLEVPEGAATDGGSIPGICWSVPGFQPFGECTWPGYVFHDAAYKQKLYVITRDGTRMLVNFTRQQCDDLLLEIMLWLGEDYVHAYTIYNAVREFGQAAFDRDRNAQP